MPEPLSIAVAVAGLLKATYGVSTTLTAFCTGVSRAPKAVHDALDEIRGISSVLRQLESYLDRVTTAPRSRTSLLTLEEIVATLTDCVCALSELENILNGLKTESMGAIDRLKWMWHKDAMIKITERIEKHKTSLTLMLNILTCESQHDAAEAAARLATLVEQLLAENRDLMTRLQTSDYANLTADSISRLARDDTSTIGPATDNEAARDDEITFPLPRQMDPGSQSDGTGSISFTVDIEMSLQASWVYRRAQNPRDRSSMMNDGQTWGLSYLSEISLSEISNISVVALPISIVDITNGQHYNTPLLRSSTNISSGYSVPEIDLLVPSINPTARRVSRDDRPINCTLFCAFCDEQLERGLRGEEILLLGCGDISHQACFFKQLKLNSNVCPKCQAGLDPHNLLSESFRERWSVTREELEWLLQADGDLLISSKGSDITWAACPAIPTTSQLSSTNADSAAPALVHSPKPAIEAPGQYPDVTGAAQSVLQQKADVQVHISPLPAVPGRDENFDHDHPPSSKSLLSGALDKSNTAVLLDNAANLEGAIAAYKEACRLLRRVMHRANSEDRAKLSRIRNTYRTRSKELEALTTRLLFEEIEEGLATVGFTEPTDESLEALPEESALLLVDSPTTEAEYTSPKGGSVSSHRDSLSLYR